MFNKEQVMEELKELIREISENEVIREEDNIMEDLGLASIDIFNLLGEIEIKFNIRISERVLKNIETVADCAEVICETLTKK